MTTPTEPQLRINATRDEARASARHTREQWDRFYYLTKEDTRQLSEAHPEWTKWIQIPSNQKDRMLERINARLRAEEIPVVNMNLLKWRVSQLLRDIQRKYAEGSMISGMGSSSAGSQTQPQAASERSVQQAQSPQRSESSPSESRPYDPIRDV